MTPPENYHVNSELRDKISREWAESKVRVLGGQFHLFERRVLWEELAQRETIIKLQGELIEQLRARIQNFASTV